MNMKERKLHKEAKIKESRTKRLKQELAKIDKLDTYQQENKLENKEEILIEKKIIKKEKKRPMYNKRKQPIMKDRLSNILRKLD
ncbi:hypothetical protein GVAV_003040 [Gurleya vavrai]